MTTTKLWWKCVFCRQRKRQRFFFDNFSFSIDNTWDILQLFRRLSIYYFGEIHIIMSSRVHDDPFAWSANWKVRQLTRQTFACFYRCFFKLFTFLWSSQTHKARRHSEKISFDTSDNERRRRMCGWNGFEFAILDGKNLKMMKFFWSLYRMRMLLRNF